jgi:hypothetical protein
MRKSPKITAIVAGGVLVLGSAGAAGATLAGGGQSTVVKPAANAATAPFPPASTGGSVPTGQAGADPYQSNGFFNTGALERSVANEQFRALAAAPASRYDHAGPGSATVTVTCTYLRMDTFTCSATDSDGDAGTGDEVTVARAADSWSDTGMHWTGPDIPAGTTTTVDPVSDWTAGP